MLFDLAYDVYILLVRFKIVRQRKESVHKIRIYRRGKIKYILSSSSSEIYLNDTFFKFKFQIFGSPCKSLEISPSLLAVEISTKAQFRGLIPIIISVLKTKAEQSTEVALKVCR